MATAAEQIKALEIKIAQIENNPSSVCGGAKAYYSGNQTFLTQAAQKKVDALNAKLDALLDSVEAA